MGREVMSFNMIHGNMFTNNWKLIECSHIIGDMVIGGEKFLVALEEGDGSIIVR